jgi:plasmid stabilization system protein ParE
MVKWTPKSELDLDEIREYIAKNFNVDLAITTANELVNYTEGLLISNSLAGSIVEENPFFSKLVFKGNSIFYCDNPQDKNIYIVYVQPRGTAIKKERLNREEVA